MKIKILSVVTLLVLGCTFISPFTTFADSVNTNTTAAATEAAEVTTTSSNAITLTLQDAYTKLESSSTRKQLDLNKKSDEAVAKGYAESYSTAIKQEAAANASTDFSSYSSANNKMYAAQKKFAASMIEANNTARLSKMNRDAFEKYFTIENAAQKLAIAQNNLSLKEKLLVAANQKYEQGTVSKADVLNATINVKTAEDQSISAKNTLENLKMNFNIYLGYDLLQELVLTDSIQESDLSETSLEDAIKAALENRNEIKQATYNLELAQLNFNNYKAYPTSSAKYLTAETKLLMAQSNVDIMPATIEMDIRSKYSAMTEKYHIVQTGKQNVLNAEEATRIAESRYSVGMSTLSDVQQAQITQYNAQLSQANSLLEFKLAVEDYNLAAGIGITAANL
ncbi:MAG: TolC family protein [Peptostreptococcaceae bacterium]|nr:TolC family protein [Peptostreptococcaceae bacterium]